MDPIGPFHTGQETQVGATAAAAAGRAVAAATARTRWNTYPAAVAGASSDRANVREGLARATATPRRFRHFRRTRSRRRRDPRMTP